MSVRMLFVLAAALALLVSSVNAHGFLTSPTPRNAPIGTNSEFDWKNSPAGFEPTDPNIICRGAAAATPKTQVTAGGNLPISWSINAAHVGGCFLYISYDANQVDQTKMQWFKIWETTDCKKSVNYNVAIPDFLPQADHAVLRWEWYGLHNYESKAVEYYAQCVDVKVTASSQAAPLSAIGPKVTMPGHLPARDAPNYWNAFSPAKNINGATECITGPLVATPDGNGFSAYKQCNPALPFPLNPKSGSVNTAAPVTSAPVTSAPVTSAPVTSAPVTSAPVTSAPVTSAPVTSAPVTPAPATRPPVTPAPATSAPVTSAPPAAATQKPTTPTNAPSSANQACSDEGKLQCSGSGYLQCANGRQLYRACAQGLVCKESGSYLYCGWP